MDYALIGLAHLQDMRYQAECVRDIVVCQLISGMNLVLSWDLLHLWLVVISFNRSIINFTL